MEGKNGMILKEKNDEKVIRKIGGGRTGNEKKEEGKEK